VLDVSQICECTTPGLVGCLLLLLHAECCCCLSNGSKRLPIVRKSGQKNVSHYDMRCLPASEARWMPGQEFKETKGTEADVWHASSWLKGS